MRVAIKRIFAVNCELIKHLRPPSPEWGGVFYGRHNTPAFNGITTRWRGRGAPPRVLPHGRVGEYAPGAPKGADLSSLQTSDGGLGSNEVGPQPAAFSGGSPTNASRRCPSTPATLTPTLRTWNY